ncbi:hypothetical protein WN943_016430 [Citrus x changshan-huyou]
MKKVEAFKPQQRIKASKLQSLQQEEGSSSTPLLLQPLRVDEQCYHQVLQQREEGNKQAQNVGSGELGTMIGLLTVFDFQQGNYSTNPSSNTNMTTIFCTCQPENTVRIRRWGSGADPPMLNLNRLFVVYGYLLNFSPLSSAVASGCQLEVGQENFKVGLLHFQIRQMNFSVAHIALRLYS